jgi:hypothetical protein
MLFQNEISFVHELLPSVLFHHENALKVSFVHEISSKLHE